MPVMELLIRDVMTRNVISFNKNDPLVKVLETLYLKNISGAPVVEKGKIVGIITEKDILKILGRKHILQAERNDLEKLVKIKVKDAMKTPVITIEENRKIYEAARIMNKYNINRLPVLLKGKLVGIITRADIIRGIVKEVAQTKIIKKDEVIKTDVDKLLELLDKKGRITIEEAAEELGVSEEDIEEWAVVLDEHGLIEYFIPTFGKPELRKK